MRNYAVAVVAVAILFALFFSGSSHHKSAQLVARAKDIMKLRPKAALVALEEAQKLMPSDEAVYQLSAEALLLQASRLLRKTKTSHDEVKQLAVQSNAQLLKVLELNPSGYHRDTTEKMLVKSSQLLLDTSSFQEASLYLYKAIQLVPTLHHPREHYSHKFPLDMRLNQKFTGLSASAQQSTLQWFIDMFSTGETADAEWRMLSKINYAHALYCQGHYLQNASALDACTATYREALEALSLDDEAELAVVSPAGSIDKVHIVAVGTDTSKKQFLQLQRSIRAANTSGLLSFQVLGAGQSWNGTGMKCTLIEDHLATLDPDTFVITTDAYDTLVFPTIQQAPQLFEGFNASIVVSAERTFWPDNGMETLYPPHIGIGAQRFPFLNSGNIAGRARHLLAMHKKLRARLGDQFLYDDQRALQMYFLANQQRVALDHNGALFWTLHKCGCADDVEPGQRCDPCQYEVRKGQIYSVEGKQNPAVLHGNGLDGKQIFDHIADSIFPVVQQKSQ